MSTGYFTPPPGKPYNPPGSLDLVLSIVTREEWYAEKPLIRQSNKHPIKLIVEHFTYTEPCNTRHDCVKAMQDMQKDHRNQGFSDIKYNFLVGGDGRIYEGRGWHVCPSKSLIEIPNMLRRRLDIAYIGDFTGKEIPGIMVQRKTDVVDFALRLMMMKPTYLAYDATKQDTTSTPSSTQHATTTTISSSTENATDSNTDSGKQAETC